MEPNEIFKRVAAQGVVLYAKAQKKLLNLLDAICRSKNEIICPKYKVVMSYVSYWMVKGKRVYPLTVLEKAEILVKIKRGQYRRPESREFEVDLSYPNDSPENSHFCRKRNSKKELTAC